MDRLSGQSQGSTMKHVTRKELSKFRVIYPTSLSEQKKIARILQTIDRAIEKTEALIEKYQQIKAGLMHDLFTRGIGPDGQLRPPREQAPELYQETPIGWIPKEWEVHSLSYYISYISYGFTNPMPSTDEGPYMVTAANIFNGRVQYETARHTELTSFIRLLSEKSKPKVGDILLTKDGTLGRLAIVDCDQICINQSVAVMRPNGKCDTDFLLYLLQSEKYQRKMLDDAGGSTIKHIYITVVDKMLVAVPKNPKEQAKVSALANTYSSSLEVERATLEKLEKQKIALMHDLLTGKVPVQVEEPETEPEAAHV
jgi:type I restriction enzyme S subunit